MKTKLVPLALLIPVVVLAQPAAQTPTPQPPQAGVVQNPQVNPANAAGAVSALNNAKKKVEEVKSKLPSNGEVGSDWSCAVGEDGTSC